MQDVSSPPEITALDTDLTAVKTALAGISDTELAALIAATKGKPRRSGACDGAESATTCGVSGQDEVMAQVRGVASLR
jgi:hypothetical protein